MTAEERSTEAIETAKAVQGLSRFGVTVVEAGQELATYVGRVLGTVPEDAVGLSSATRSGSSEPPSQRHSTRGSRKSSSGEE